jgi:phage tail sheath protein FI
VDSGNDFISDLVRKGALMEGSRMYLDPELNTAEQLAAGRIYFDLECMGPPPAERITVRSHMNIALLASIVTPRD